MTRITSITDGVGLLTCVLCNTQDGTLLSFGRPTYGRLGRSGVDVNSDEGVSEPMAVDGLGEATIVSAAAGVPSLLRMPACRAARLLRGFLRRAETQLRVGLYGVCHGDHMLELSIDWISRGWDVSEAIDPTPVMVCAGPSAPADALQPMPCMDC